MTADQELAEHRRIFGAVKVKAKTPIAFPPIAETVTLTPPVFGTLGIEVAQPVAHYYNTEQHPIRTNHVSINPLPPARRPRPTWVKLARVLAHELRHPGGHVVRERDQPRYDLGHTRYEPSDTGDARVLAEHFVSNTGDAQEDYELAEALASALADALPHLAKAASGDAVKAPTNVCPTCTAESGAWCRPTHEGERVSGGWQHPARREPRAHAKPANFGGSLMRGFADGLEYGEHKYGTIAQRFQRDLDVMRRGSITIELDKTVNQTVEVGSYVDMTTRRVVHATTHGVDGQLGRVVRIYYPEPGGPPRVDVQVA